LASRAALRSLVMASTNDEGRGQEVNSFMRDVFPSSAAVLRGEGACRGRLPRLQRGRPEALFNYSEGCLKLIVCNNELQGLSKALEGEFVTLSPGGDPVWNTGMLPNGKNMDALDPNSIPIKAAVQTVFVVLDSMLESGQAGRGSRVHRVHALGTGHIKTYGERLAQVLALVGARPVPDGLGRVNKVELIPLSEELGRPRSNIVHNCSGGFRDLFINQINLLDRAIKMAAEADEPIDMNYLRKRA